jgi:hypothetical protein
MRLNYICSQCGSAIDQIHVQSLDESAFGFDCLTEAERQEFLTFDLTQNTVTVRSLCDNCIEDLGLEPVETATIAVRWVH